VDHPSVMLEVMVQEGPLNGKRSVHNDVSTPASGPVLCRKRYDQAPDQSVLTLSTEGVVAADLDYIPRAAC